MSGPSIRRAQSWAKFERHTLEIFTIALEMLSAEFSLPALEDSESQDNLNRRLEQYIPSAICKWEALNQRESIVPCTPRFNSRQPARLSDREEVRDFERKKPDFQWELRDSRGIGVEKENPDRISRFYPIECKRLRSRSSSTRFPYEYVVNGICRFTKRTHCYGQDASSGAMIAYIQDMDLQTLLNEVNTEATQAALPHIILTSPAWQPIVSRLDHCLHRTEVQPTPFDLRHLWVDLRHHYSNSTLANGSGEQDKSPVPPKRTRQSKRQSSQKKPSNPRQQKT